ncbi:MAG: TonB-dependent receptor, partial [Bacteroidota bacterium]
SGNNPRQIYSQVAGLNIYENNDAGLQLNIGGRGLDPNRSANFNTRQNGYDISADVLGYPESYYTPPAEALSEIQVIRGAASLQYGTQFGGLINFKFKQPLEDKKIQWVSRQSLGSNNLFTTFNSLSGKLGKFSYYTYFNYKQGDGFRPNSEFESTNFYTDLHYQLSKKTLLDAEFTYLSYLAQQPGGLTDARFVSDPTFSNRERNWFSVDWRLLSLKLIHEFSEKAELSVNWFGLDASRKAVGFRTNRVSQVDDPMEPRDLILGDFNNWGVETRFLKRYDIGKRKAIFLIGQKYYDSDNTAVQGPGSAAADADFNLFTNEFSSYPNQSDFRFPNLNVAVFGENIFYLSDNFSLTPGFRFEYIKTESEGTFEKINFDLAGNPILDTTFTDNRDFERSFVLLGVGASYKPTQAFEAYGNFSQNYRSVTFSDIRIVNPSFQIDPNISDENGFTADLGMRGRLKNFLSYDINVFGLLYNDRLGEVLRAETRLDASGRLVETGRVIRFRGNIGTAFIYGLESLIDWNIRKTFFKYSEDYRLGIFLNTAITQSNYIESEIPGVEGKQVEFIPLVNLKSGLNFGYKNLLGNLQFSYLSEQFTDASNAPQNVQDNQSGIQGAIPAYSILDLSLSYRFKMFQLEAGANNLLNQWYFTRRATGYPGPGIIPSAPRTWYVALQVKLEKE